MTHQKINRIIQQIGIQTAKQDGLKLVRCGAAVKREAGGVRVSWRSNLMLCEESLLRKADRMNLINQAMELSGFVSSLEIDSLGRATVLVRGYRDR